jgi:hypothetical protein
MFIADTGNRYYRTWYKCIYQACKIFYFHFYFLLDDCMFHGLPKQAAQSAGVFMDGNFCNVV